MLWGVLEFVLLPFLCGSSINRSALASLAELQVICPVLLMCSGGSRLAVGSLGNGGMPAVEGSPWVLCTQFTFISKQCHLVWKLILKAKSKHLPSQAVFPLDKACWPQLQLSVLPAVVSVCWRGLCTLWAWAAFASTLCCVLSWSSTVGSERMWYLFSPFSCALDCGGDGHV